MDRVLDIHLLQSSVRRAFTIRLKRLRARAPDFGDPQHFGTEDNFQNFRKKLSSYFCFASTHVFYFTMPLTKDLCRRSKWMTMSTLFLWRWELVIVAYNVWCKMPESIFQVTRGQWGTVGYFRSSQVSLLFTGVGRGPGPPWILKFDIFILHF